MEYTIQQLSRLAGVSTRTLRWYDEIGLLPPMRTADSGYRIYGPEQVDRLQLILFYRALGVELKQIKAMLDAPSFDRLTALRAHLCTLEEQERKLTEQIASVRETILAAEQEETMSDEAKFRALKEQAAAENEKRYGPEARQKYGDAQVDAANRNWMGLNQQEYDRWQQLDRDILSRLEQAVENGLAPEGEVGREITALHREWLTFTIRDYTPEKHRGIAQLYVLDERFTAYYDKNRPGCAAFLTACVSHWAK